MIVQGDEAKIPLTVEEKMKKRVLTFLVLVCFGLGIFVVEGFSATAWQKPKVRSISEDINVDGRGLKSYRAPSRAISKYYIPSGAKLTCDDINPQVGTIIQHDQIGDTWYDYQKNGSMGRMISVTNEGYRHFSWTYTDHPYPPGPRYVDANCKNPAGAYIGQVHADGGDVNAGYSNQTHLHDGTSVVIYHHTAGQSGNPVMNSVISIGDSICSRQFDRLWDLPDSILDAISGENGLYPKAAVLHDPVEKKDYIHIIMWEPNYAGCLLPNLVGYQRCHLGAADTLICESCVEGSTAMYRLAKNTNYSDPAKVITHLGRSCFISPVVVVSPVSRRVAVAFTPNACTGDEYCCDYLSDVSYVESMNNGDDWVNGTNWPPPEHNITNFGCTGTERAFGDIAACYDFQDSLHIVYVTCGFDPDQPGYYQPGVARLYHWSKKDGTSTIHSAIWEGTDPGSHNLNIAKMSISAQDPIYHPGGDSVYLFCIWTQFDTADQSASDMTNGDIYGSGSFNGGDTWGWLINLTNTKTPGCNPGECVSEHWSSLARNMYNGDLHIQYICDLDAGGAIMDGTEWMAVPVYYLHLAEWQDPIGCIISYRFVDPPHWYRPPLKVTPGGSRTLLLELANIGNVNCPYDVVSDHECIEGNYSGVLAPMENIIVPLTVKGGGTCDSTFIGGNVLLTSGGTGGSTDYLPVQAVVANDYYECPIDPETYDTLENGVLRLYTNANCEEQIHDIGTFPDTTHEVFFEGGTIVATTSGSDTVVGRFMREDWRAGARDKLYMEECHVDWEPDFWILYTKNIFIHNLNPPVYDFTWYWWEVSKQIKFFKEEAPEVYKHLVIKYVTVKRHDPPGWWPDQSPFTGYEDTYIGVAEDIDCPYDTMQNQNGRNYAGYDVSNEIAWQRGWDYTGAHPEYNDYYCGIALADAGMPGENTVPYATHNVLNHQYLYPQGDWGWLDQELYELAATPPVGQIDSAGLPRDRSQVFTAQMIPGGTDTTTKAFFTIVKVVAPNGLAELQAMVDTARAIVEKERLLGGLPALCGDCNGDFVVDIGDIIKLIGYLFKGAEPPRCPINRGDCNSDGVIDVGDIVVLINYLFKGEVPPVCPGIW